MQKFSLFVVAVGMLAIHSFSSPSQKVSINGVAAVVSASSELKGSTPGAYSVKHVFDRNPATAWAEGATGPGEGEWIELQFDQAQVITSIQIWNGYQKSESLYKANSRAGFAAIYIDDHSESAAGHELGKTGTIPVHRIAKKLRIQFTSIIQGDKYADLCISDIGIQFGSVAMAQFALKNPVFQKAKGLLVIPIQGHQWFAVLDQSPKKLSGCAVDLNTKQSQCSDINSNDEPVSRIQVNRVDSLPATLPFPAFAVSASNEWERTTYLCFIQNTKQNPEMGPCVWYSASGTDSGGNIALRFLDINQDGFIDIKGIECVEEKCGDKPVFELINDSNTRLRLKTIP